MSPAEPASLREKTIGNMLAHEQFPVPELAEIGRHAAEAGFGLLATSDHFQPWQANEAHSGLAWVTMGALGERARSAWIGTTVTCPTLRYHPAVVAGRKTARFCFRSSRSRVNRIVQRQEQAARLSCAVDRE